MARHGRPSAAWAGTSPAPTANHARRGRRSERDIVVEATLAGGCRRAAARGTAATATAVAIAGLELVRAAVRTRAHPAAATLAAVEHGELAAELPQHDLGRVLFRARLVGPF